MNNNWWKPSIYILAEDVENFSPCREDHDDYGDDETHPLAYLDYYSSYEEDDG